MPKEILLRGTTTAEADAHIGPDRELTCDPEGKNLRLHDGVTPGGTVIGSPGGGGGGGGMPAGVYGVTGTDFMALPHNQIKFDGGLTNGVANEGVYMAAWFLFPTTINDIGVIIRTADAGATDTRVCIYDQHSSTGLPNNLLFGSGNLDVSATGYVSEAPPSPITLHGVYWFGFKSDSTAVNTVALNNTGGHYWGHPNGMGNGTGRAQFPRSDNLVGAWPTSATIDGTKNLGSFSVVGFNGN